MNSMQALALADAGAQSAHESSASNVAHRLSEGQANSIYASAYHLSKNGRHDQASALFALLGMYRPQEPKYTHAVAVCFRELGQYEDAIRMFARTVELSPGDYTPTFNLIQCLLLLDQREKAIDLLQTVAKAAREEGQHHTLERATVMLELLQVAMQ